MLELHGFTIYEDTIVALRMVKDELNPVGGLLNSCITHELISDVKNSFSKYEADIIVIKTVEEEERVQKCK